MEHDLFISYSHKDSQMAMRICRSLENSGVRCWIAPRDVAVGSNYAEAIVQAISASHSILLIFSSNSNESEHVLREVERAASKKIPIIAFRVDDVSPTKAMEYFLGIAQWFDAFDPPMDDHLQELAAAILDRLKRNVEPPKPKKILLWLKRIDRRDWLVAGIVPAAALGMWLARARLSAAEEQLYAALILSCLLVWFAFRKIRIRGLQRVFLTGKVLLPVFLAAALGYATYRTYRIPPFPDGVSGLYIARLSGDLYDLNQTRILKNVREYLQQQEIPDVRAMPLPRRIQNAEAARTAGRNGGAAIVLWGQMNEGDVPDVRVVMVEPRGVHQATAGIALREGFKSDTESMSLPQEIRLVETLVAEFLAGFHYYRDGQTENAERHFSNALAKATSSNNGENANRVTPLETTIATLNFYLGNVYALRQNWNSAIEAYKAALKTARRPTVGTPLFLEPFANLGMALLQRGGQRDLADAIEILQEADQSCENTTFDKNAACLYVRYDLGTAYNMDGKYEKAHDELAKLIDRWKQIADSNLEQHIPARLLANAYRSQAYSTVKMADVEFNRDTSELRYKNAEGEWSKGIDVLRRNGEDIPLEFRITRARIHIGLHEWQKALDLLAEPLKAVHNPSPQDELNSAYRDLLLARTYRCLGNTTEFLAHLELFTKSRAIGFEERVHEAAFAKGQCGIQSQ